MICGWVIDHLARFRRGILGGGVLSPSGFQGCVDPTSPNLARTNRSWLHNKFVSEFRYLAAFSNAGSSNLSDVENDAKFRTLTPCENYGKGGRDFYTSCWSFTYERTSEKHSMAIHCAAAERAWLIKKGKKGSSWAKLKVFPTNVGRPNQSYGWVLDWVTDCTESGLGGENMCLLYIQRRVKHTYQTVDIFSRKTSQKKIFLCK